MSPEQDKLQRIFTQALAAASKEERDRYLQETCGEDLDLRFQLDSLLAAHSESGHFLRDNIFVPHAIGEGPGSLVGRYKLLQQIGEGGFGMVFMAEQQEPVRRVVAVKILKPGMDTKEVVARFEAGRQALALMDHPNIARVLDGGATESGRPYFVMEMVRGIPITEFCEQNRLSMEERLRLFVKVCAGVQHAHQKGIIHRDLKPSNVLVTRDDGEPVPKVIDFGIAKAIEGRLTELTVYTDLHLFVGTPAYMSPEQAEVKERDIDTRSDIYSLGVLLYELLTGYTPFDAKELLASGLDVMRRAIREREPVRPSTRLSSLSGEALTTTAQRRGIDSSRLIHRIRGDLDWIVMKCLEKDRTRRYETANGLAVELRRFLADEPVIARPPSQLYRIQKLVRRNRTGALATAVVGLALLLCVIVSTWAAVRATKSEREQSILRRRAETSRVNEAKQRETAEKQEKLANAEAAKSAQIARFLKGMLGEVRASVALGRDTTIVKDILDKTAERVDGSLTNQPEVQAELCEIIGDTYQALSLFSEARSMQGAALRLREKLFGSNSLPVACSMEKLSAALGVGKGENPVEAERLLRQAIDLRKQISQTDSQEMVHCLNALAVLRRTQLDADGAEALWSEALRIGKRVSREDNTETADSLLGLSEVLSNRGEEAGAEAKAREALAIKKKLLGISHPEVVDAMDTLPIYLDAQGKSAEAEKLYVEWLGTTRHLFGDDNPRTVLAEGFLASFYAMHRRENEAEPLWRNLLGAESEPTDPFSIASGSFARNALENLLSKNALVALAPTSDEQPVSWRYSYDKPSTDWNTQDFDDHAWSLGRGPIGNGWYQQRARTIWKWDAHDLWLRRDFDLKEDVRPPVLFCAMFGNVTEIEIYLNGVRATEVIGATGGAHWNLPCSPVAFNTLKRGRNILAVHVRNHLFFAGIDVGIYSAPEWRRSRLQFAGVLQDLLLKQPGNAELLEAHAQILVHCGEWKAAAEDYQRLIRLQPTNHWYAYVLAPLLVQKADLAGYEKLCKQMLALYGSTSDPRIAERIAKACLIESSPASKLQTAAHLAEVAISSSNNESLYPYLMFAKALADYRQGNFRAAKAGALAVLQRSGQDRCRDVQAYMVLAMANHQLGLADEARTALVRGEEIFEKEIPKPDSGYLGDAPHDWIIADVLAREVRALMKSHETASNGSRSDIKEEPFGSRSFSRIDDSICTREISFLAKLP